MENNVTILRYHAINAKNKHICEYSALKFVKADN